MNKSADNKKLLVYWLEKIIIGIDLCPFTKIPYENGLIRIAECEDMDESEQISFFLDELEHLQLTPHSKLSTTLIAYVNETKNFEDFNDFVGECEEFLKEVGLEEHFQIIVFHPEFQFHNSLSSDRSNWVNRSPFPIIHILRNSEIEMSLTQISHGESLSAKNKVKLDKMSSEEFKKLFFYLL